MNRCAKFYRVLRQSMSVLGSQNPDLTGPVVATVHFKNGVPMTVSVDFRDVPKRFDEVTAEA